jgi:NTP pyrophosphatase (non-canonical NTP hydrolase)
MELNEYEEFTRTTAVYPKKDALSYLLFGLCEEVGELHGKVKRLIRDDKFDAEGFIFELGDVLWYLTRLADETEVGIEEVVRRNVKKLTERKNKDTIKGKGDYR